MKQLKQSQRKNIMFKEEDIKIKYKHEEYFIFAKELTNNPIEFETNVIEFTNNNRSELKRIYMRKLAEDNDIIMNDSFNNWVKVIYVQYQYNKYKNELNDEINSLLG